VGVANPGGLPKRAWRRGGEGRLNKTPRNKLARPDHQKGKEEGRGGASTDRGNVACLKRREWMEVTMISRGVEISIAGGVEETKDALVTFVFVFVAFF